MGEEDEEEACQSDWSAHSGEEADLDLDSSDSEENEDNPERRLTRSLTAALDKLTRTQSPQTRLHG